MPKIGLISLGCAKNLVDSEHMLALLRAAGWEITEDMAEADVGVVNTCGFIEAAKSEAIETILDTAQYKQTGKMKGLVVTGCLVQRYADEMKTELPEIDALCGTGSYESIVDAAEAALGGADIVVQSLHKTLPSPTQTALLHLCSDRVSAEGLERQLAVFQTSSPSYLLMGGIDFCLRMVEQEGPALFAAYAKRLAAFDETIRPLARLRVLCHGADSPAAHPAFFAFDPGKLVISTRYAGKTGGWLKDRLREEYGIELEMAMGDYSLAMTSDCDEDRDLDRLARALLEIDRELEAAPCPPDQPFLPLPQVVLDPAAARQQETELCDLAQAQGRLAGEMVWAYPPGVPLLVPGERIGSPQLEALDRLTRQEVELHSESGFVPKKIRVLAPRY